LMPTRTVMRGCPFAGTQVARSPSTLLPTLTPLIGPKVMYQFVYSVPGSRRVPGSDLPPEGARHHFVEPGAYAEATSRCIVRAAIPWAANRRAISSAIATDL